jgi:hypothetical protein
LTPLVALVIATTALLGMSAAPAAAEPNTPAGTGTTPGDEGAPVTIKDLLEEANRGYVQARAALAASKRKQLELNLRLGQVQQRLDEVTAEVSGIAANAYRTGRLRPVEAMLNSTTPDAFLERAEAMETLARLDDQKLRRLNDARTEVARTKAAVDAETAQQAKQLAIMDKKKKDANRALVQVGGLRVTGGLVNITSPVARPAPRSADGGWSPQSCSQNDPTTSGCITGRTLHAMQEARRLGFKRFVSCFRPGGPYEHPKGRACDFSSQQVGFGGDAQGGDKVYGNNLAAFFVRNADRLGVLYVIWYRQFWSPATGWKSYSGAGGDPSSDHTNHVHLSLI